MLRLSKRLKMPMLLPALPNNSVTRRRNLTKLFHAVCVHHSEQAQKSRNIVLVVVKRFLQRLTNRLKSCKVDHGIKGRGVRATRWRARKERADGCSIAQVGLRRKEEDPWRQSRERG